ncbi:Methionine aminopeptidase 1 [Trachymyrmex zeteki]|uniref:Methionine aminopeptidase 1 n=1 Tax=Mycetomoellerius zeteki TaxID=64791 RepID=A0A151WNS9_9HYME|nr:Methionine aminopeptidase 1 [Trachymyrmex zeteki]
MYTIVDDCTYATLLNLISIALGMCKRVGCNAVACSQCPTCLKIGIQCLYFCSQNCFKGYESIAQPNYALHPAGIPLREQAVKDSGQIKILDDEKVEGMRVACKLGREVLDEADVTTSEIDRMVHEACIERDYYPSPLNWTRYQDTGHYR